MSYVHCLYCSATLDYDEEREVGECARCECKPKCPECGYLVEDAVADCGTHAQQGDGGQEKGAEKEKRMSEQKVGISDEVRAAVDRCLTIIFYTDPIQGGGGYHTYEDARATLRAAMGKIRQEFGLPSDGLKPLL